jgi:NAD(P)-dependent dehydrogenase (short-subunit alcohol dehydrogenase family)
MTPINFAVKSQFCMEESSKSQTSRNEMGRPEEIATVALFLASSDSSFVDLLGRETGHIRH